MTAARSRYTQQIGARYKYMYNKIYIYIYIYECFLAKDTTSGSRGAH